MQLSRLALCALVIAALGACENRGLRDLRGTGDGPDEFIVTPVKPLATPENLSELPVPTPGQSNLVDLQPRQDGAAALGGSRPTGGAVPASDAALVAHAARNGVSPTIRDDLAAQDADFRRRRGRLTQIRIVPVDRYNQVYESQALDPDLVAEQYRLRGVPTPAAPPANRRFNPT
ncbi:MAG: DUF3035 domain-containing protein [Pseudomonadota bacterium]